MSLADCIDAGLIVMGHDHCYYVIDAILAIKLWRLPPGLTSNMFRLLNAKSKATVTEVAQHVGVHVDRDTQTRMKVTEEDIVRQANCFPFVFELNAQAAQQASLRSTTVTLDSSLPIWRVLLDCKAKYVYHVLVASITI